MFIIGNSVLCNFYHSNTKKKNKHQWPDAFMNSLLAVTVSVSSVVDNTHTLLPGNLKLIYWPYIHMHKKGWIFKIEYGPISPSGWRPPKPCEVCEERGSPGSNLQGGILSCVSAAARPVPVCPQRGAEVESGDNHCQGSDTSWQRTADNGKARREWRSKAPNPGRENGREPARTMKQDLVLRLW